MNNFFLLPDLILTPQAMGKIWQKQFPLIQGSTYLRIQCKMALYWVDGAHLTMSVTWRKWFPVSFPCASWNRDGASAMETWTAPPGILPLDLSNRKWTKHRPYTVSSLQKSHGLNKLWGMLLAHTTFNHDSVVLTDLLVCIRARWMPSFHWKTVNLIRNRERSNLLKHLSQSLKSCDEYFSFYFLSQRNRGKIAILDSSQLPVFLDTLISST